VQFAAAAEDFLDTFRKWRMWMGLGFQEIKMRYRRTTLGPFWMTLNMGLTVTMIGIVFGKLFQSDIAAYMPYLVSGVVLWNAIVLIMGEGSNCYISFTGYIKQVKQPYTLYMMIVLWRNFLAFLHNFIIVPIILLYFWIIPSWTIVLLPFSLLLVFMALMPYAMLAGIISARFRDIPQFVTNIMSAIFFVSPVIWKVETLGTHAYLAYLNPIAHLLDIVRAPLLGQPLIWFVFPAVVFMAVVGWLVLFVVFARFRARIAYWV
jgi:ABC-type polysaccharide/polyol phosphate export permease